MFAKNDKGALIIPLLRCFLAKKQFDILDNEFIKRLQHLALYFDEMYSGYCMVGDFNWSTDEIKAEPYRMDIVNGAWCHLIWIEPTKVAE